MNICINFGRQKKLSKAYYNAHLDNKCFAYKSNYVWKKTKGPFS